MTIPSPKMREGGPLSWRVALSKTTTHTPQRSAPMVDIVALLQCTRPHVTATTVRQWSRISGALMAMTGRVTMGGRARWAGKGGSSRTIQRFCATGIPWGILFWGFFRHHVYRAEDVYLLVGDAVLVTKAGKSTHGLDRFFAQGWPSSPYRSCGSRLGARFPCVSSTSCAATRTKPPARPKQRPRRPRFRGHSVGLGVPRAARTPAKPTGP